MNTLIISYYRFPEGDAGSVRCYAFAKIFQELGHNVKILGMGESEESEKNYNGIYYKSLRLKNNTKINKIKNYILFKERLKKELEKYKNIDLLYVYDIPINAIIFLKKYAKKNNSQIIHDSVEWYSKEQFKFGRFDIRYQLKNILNKYIIDKNFKVVAISQFLYNYFSSKGIKTVRIPVIMDAENIKFNKINKNSDKLILMYAGSPGKKDYLITIINAIKLLSETQKNKVELRIFGLSKEELCIKKLDTINNIKFYGRVKHDVIINNLKEADFTVLIRNANLRYAKAGFPTKVVESLSTGTPIILNNSSDISLYIRDGKEGIIVKDDTAEELYKVIKKAIEMSSNKKEIMRKFSRNCALQNFDYRNYIETMKNFISGDRKND